MKQTKWTKKRSEGLPRWAMGLLMGLCIGLIVVALGGLVIYVLPVSYTHLRAHET